MTRESSELPPLHLRRWLGAIAVAVLLYGAVSLVDVWYATRQVATGEAEAALVLGAAQYNGRPSPVLVRRLNRAAELYADGRVSIVVVTGGQQVGDVTTKAKSGYDYLRAKGIPDDDLRLEVKGDSTYTSLAAASRFLRPEGVDSVILVTDAYHARRVALIADEVGFDAEVSAVGSTGWGPLARETAAVSIGRVISFRRLDNVAR